MGAKGLEIYDGLSFKNDTDKDHVEKALGLLEEYYVGIVNVTHERFKFHSRDQLEGDGTRAYISELERLAHTCDFGRITPYQLIRDRLICGMRSDSLQKRLLQETELTMYRCVKVCQGAEASSVQGSTMATVPHIKTKSDSELKEVNIASRK